MITVKIITVIIVMMAVIEVAVLVTEVEDVVVVAVVVAVVWLLFVYLPPSPPSLSLPLAYTPFIPSLHSAVAPLSSIPLPRLAKSICFFGPRASLHRTSP